MKEKNRKDEEMLPLAALELFNEDIMVLEDSMFVCGGVEMDVNNGCNCHCDQNCSS